MAQHDDRIPSTVELLDRFRKGDHEAAKLLIEKFYYQLRRIAAVHMRSERPGHTLQPTALVNELCLKVSQQKSMSSVSDPQNEKLRTEADFLRLARYLMAQILIEHGRRRLALKRRHTRVELEEALAVQVEPDERHAEVLAALDRLEAQDPELRRLVDLRYFCGHNNPETARMLGMGATKAKADLRLAKLWLQRELGGLGNEFGEDEESPA
jgi:RNA polymerase sigma factor (TIGR02999 family)